MVRKLSLGLGVVLLAAALPVWAQAHSAPQGSPAEVLRVKKLTNQVLAGQQRNYVAALLGIGTTVAELKSAALERQALMLQLARTNPSQFLQLAIAPAKRRALPAEVQPYIEESFTGEGTLEVLYQEDFGTHDLVVKTFLHQGAGRWNLSTTKSLDLTSGARLKISGFRLGQTVVAETGEVQVLSGGVPQAITGTVQLLVIPVEFSNSGSRLFTREQLVQRIFSGPFQSFYQEESYRRLSFTGQVTDWVHLERPIPSVICDAVDVEDPEIADYLTSHNITATDYYAVVFLLSSNSSNGDGSCATLGGVNSDILNTASIAIPYSPDPFNFPFAWERFDHALAHEVGHTLGLGHALGLDCGEVPLASNCQYEQYGNYYDVMGAGTFATHFNAFAKEKLGWITPAEALTINQSGEYTIGALEHSLDYRQSSYRLAKIQIGDNPPFYLEYRRAVGFDRNLTDPNLTANQDGLMINLVSIAATSIKTSKLLTMRPDTAHWLTNVDGVSLNGANTFTDPVSGVIIGPIIRHDDYTITFRVTMPGEAGFSWRDLF